MSTVSASEAGTRFGEILERVARGEEILIMRHDTPVARIIPVGQPPSAQVDRAAAQPIELRSRIQARRRGRPTLSDAEVHAAIEQGRR